jgi:hypothetical protein
MVAKKAKRIPNSVLRKIVVAKPRAVRSKLQMQLPRAKMARGSATRGWHAAAPQRGKERQTLYNMCGSMCFLAPQTLGFPICAALREGQGCRVDCRGVVAARVRAAQYKHADVLKKSNRVSSILCK